MDRWEAIMKMHFSGKDRLFPAGLLLMICLLPLCAVPGHAADRKNGEKAGIGRIFFQQQYGDWLVLCRSLSRPWASCLLQGIAADRTGVALTIDAPLEGLHRISLAIPKQEDEESDDIWRLLVDGKPALEFRSENGLAVERGEKAVGLVRRMERGQILTLAGENGAFELSLSEFPAALESYQAQAMLFAQPAIDPDLADNGKALSEDQAEAEKDPE